MPLNRCGRVFRRIHVQWAGEHRSNGDYALRQRDVSLPPSASDHHPPVTGAFARLLVTWKLAESQSQSQSISTSECDSADPPA